MPTDPRAALDRLVAALEAHFLAAQRRRSEQDPAVEHAFGVLADAFETYDDALFDAYGETTPFELYEDDEDDGETEDDEDSDEEDSDDEDSDDEDSDDEDSDEEDIEEADLTPDEDDLDDDDLVDT